MPGFDSLIGKSFSKIISTHIGQTTLSKVEQRLFEKYGINLKNTPEDFQKLDNVLREFFGDSTIGIERKVLKQIITIEQTRQDKKEWIVIEDKNLIKSILGALGDDDKKSIMNSIIGTPKIISDILDDCKIPQTSGYRKINSLIEDGFLVVDGHNTTHDGKRVNKYTSIFENIKIDIEKNLIVLRVQLTEKSKDSSAIIQLLRSKEQLVTVE